MPPTHISHIWAFNMKMRHQLLSQANVYLHQHPADAQLTIEDLRDMVGRTDADQLMKRLQVKSRVQATRSIKNCMHF